MSFIGKPLAHLLNNKEQIGQFGNGFPSLAFSCFIQHDNPLFLNRHHLRVLLRRQRLSPLISR